MVKAAEGSIRLKERGKKCLKRTLKLPYLQGLWSFLTADSYMYGALLRSAGANGDLRVAEAVIRKELRRKKKLRITRNGRDVKLFQKTEDIKNNQQVTQSTFCVNVQHVATPDAQERLSMRNKDIGTVGTGTPSWNEETETEDTSVADVSETSAGSGLEDHEAERVVDKLVNKFGGRNSKELGIDVDEGDDEVEKWFLAVALFNRRNILDLSTETFKNILNSGIAKLSDTLKTDPVETAKILERAGYKSYPERTAARLHRLAIQLKTEHGGTICSFRTVNDPQELIRQLSGLFGLSQSSIRLFLSEMRGVWQGVSSAFDKRAENAARHLKLIGSKMGPADERDVEAALTKFSIAHARHYRDCPGGIACEMLEDDTE